MREQKGSKAQLFTGAGRGDLYIHHPFTIHISGYFRQGKHLEESQEVSGKSWCQSNTQMQIKCRK